MTGRKNRVLQVPTVVPYKALRNFSKPLYGTTGGTCSDVFFRPVMLIPSSVSELPSYGVDSIKYSPSTIFLTNQIDYWLSGTH